MTKDCYAPCSLLSFEQSWIALTICEYPVHRHIFPRICSRISSSEGFGFSSRRDFPMSTIPGVQKPHWTAPCSRKDCWIGWRLPSGFASPSTVKTSLPSIPMASVRHDSTGSPSTRTVQDPHSPMPHPYFAPVSPNCSLRTLRSNSLGATRISRFTPLTFKVICFFNLPSNEFAKGKEQWAS